MRSVSAVSARRAIFFLTALIAILVDQVTKQLAINALSDGQNPKVIGDLLKFLLVYNDSAAFSMGVGQTWVLALIAIAAVLALLWFGPRAKSKSWSLIYGLVLGGASGNLIDRLIREPGFLNGHVVDFLQIPFNFPIFNLADSALVIGVSLAIIRTLLGDEIGGKRAG
jgi:signal peptidase II